MSKRYYVCIASQFAEANVLPALWPGERYDRILVLAGVTGQKSDDDEQARGPAKRYKALFETHSRSRGIPIDMEEVPATAVEPTRDKLAAWLADKDGELLVNVSGGLRRMGFAALQAGQTWVEHKPAQRGYKLFDYDPRPSPHLVTLAQKGDAALPVRGINAPGASMPIPLAQAATA